MKYLGHTYTKILFPVHVKLRFNWPSSILSVIPTPNPEIILLSLQLIKKDKGKQIAMNAFCEALTFSKNTISHKMVLQNILESSV